ncbi:MAG: ribosomal protein S18-alanine N-acetyltransferase [Gemmatimonadales bacterium]
MAGPWSIRPASEADAAALARAERECFTDPWSEGMIRDSLQDATVSGAIAEGPEGLAGYLLARTIAGETEILNLAVLPGARRAGLGRRLLELGLADAARAGARSVYLEVRESNEAARRLYEGAGFRPVGLRPGYYRRPRENALRLMAELPGMREDAAGRRSFG